MNKKKLLHILLVALLAMTLVVCFAVCASAEEPSADDRFEVLDASNAHVGYYEELSEALSNLQSNYTLKLLADYEAADGITLNADFPICIDATGYTLTAQITHSAGTVTVKGGTFTTATGVLWTMSGSDTSLVVEGGNFSSTVAGDTTANSTVGALFVFQQTGGTVSVSNALLTANGTLFYYKQGASASAMTDVDLSLTNTTGTTKKFVVYSQHLAKGDITFAACTLTGGRVLHICNGSGEGSVTINGGTYHSMYVATAARQTDAYKAKCLVTGTSDVGGLYIGRNYALTITAGTFTFDGPGLYFKTSNKQLAISGGSFSTTVGTDNTDKEVAIFVIQNATNNGNYVQNASFTTSLKSGNYTVGVSNGNANVRGAFVIGDKSSLTVKAGTTIYAKGAGDAVNLFGNGTDVDNVLRFEGGTVSSDTGAAYSDSGSGTLGTGNTAPITFCGTSFSSGKVSDDGVMKLHSGASYLIDGGTYTQTNTSNSVANVLFNIYGLASVTIKKGEFVCTKFMRIGGASGATVATSAMILIAPEKDEDVTVTATSTNSHMFWYQGNAGYYPTLIITGGKFIQNSTNKYILGCNGGGKGNVFILGGEFSAPNKSIFLTSSANDFNLHIYGGTFSCLERFINIDNSGTGNKFSAYLYGAGTQTIDWTTLRADETDTADTFNAFAIASLTAAGLYTDGKYTFTAEGVTASVTTGPMFSAYNGSAGTGTNDGVFNFYGGTYTVLKGASQNLITDNAATTGYTFNFYGGTYNYVGGTSRMMKLYGSQTFHFYGGTFTNGVGESDMIATGTGCTATFNFYGESTYNGIATPGVTFEHLGGTYHQSIFESDDTSTTETVNIYGGLFVSAFEGYGGMFTLRHKGQFNIYGGTFQTNNNSLIYNPSGTTAISIATDESKTIDYNTKTGEAALMYITTGTVTYGTGDNMQLAFNVESDYDTHMTLKEYLAGVTDTVFTAQIEGVTGADGSYSVSGDLLLEKAWVISENLSFDGNGHTIYSTGNLLGATIRINGGVTVTFKNVTFYDELAFEINGANVTFENCTFNARGNAGAMLTLKGAANVTLTSSTLNGRNGPSNPEEAALYGSFFALVDFTGTLNITGGSVTDGAKLVFAKSPTTGNTTAGTVTVSDVTVGVKQHIFYAQWDVMTSITLKNVTATTRALHICGSSANGMAAMKGNDISYVLEGGSYTSSMSVVYVGVYRVGSLSIKDVTMTVTANVIDVRGLDRVSIDGGTYTGKNNGFNTHFFNLYADLTTTVKNATFSSTNTNNTNVQAVLYVGEGNHTLENLTVTANQSPAIYFDGGAKLTIQSGTYNGKRAIVVDSGNTGNTLVINGGEFTTTGINASNAASVTSYVIDFCGGTGTINGGSFKATCAKSVGMDTVINIAGSATTCTLTINGGYFECDGMCVARVLGGVTQGETTGNVTTLTYCTLNIKGGVFVLTNPSYRQPDSKNSYAHDAVIRCGGGTTYGTVNIEGGTFINQQPNASVINKNNSASSISITGGTFVTVANTNATYNGRFYSQSGFKNSTVGKFTYNSTEYTGLANTPTYNVTAFGDATNGITNVNIGNVGYADFAMGGKNYYVVGALDGNGDFTSIDKGAQVRISSDGTNGIRFTSTFSAEAMATLNAAAEAAGKEIEFGTVIAATAKIFNVAGGKFTIEALGGMEKKDVNFVLIEAVNGITKNDDGSVELRAALVKIKEQNYELSYSAISYAKIGDTYYYSDFDFADNSRSIAEVAQMALDDATGTLPCYDENGNVTEASTSKYTKEQQQVLYMYLGHTWATSSTEE